MIVYSDARLKVQLVVITVYLQYFKTVACQSKPLQCHERRHTCMPTREGRPFHVCKLNVRFARRRRCCRALSCCPDQQAQHQQVANGHRHLRTDEAATLTRKTPAVSVSGAGSKRRATGGTLFARAQRAASHLSTVVVRCSFRGGDERVVQRILAPDGLLGQDARKARGCMRISANALSHGKQCVRATLGRCAMHMAY